MRISGTKAISQGFCIFVACVFLQHVLWVQPAYAWDGDTHRKLVDWAYQIIKLTEYELDHTPGKPVATYLTGLSGSMTAAPSGCTGTCAAEWRVFLQKIATARGQLSKMPFGPATRNADQSTGNLTCAPSTTAKAIGSYGAALKGDPPKPADAEANSCQTDKLIEYEAGGIFDDPTLADRGSVDYAGSKALGNNLGFIAEVPDSRTGDWDLSLNPTSLVIAGISLLFTLGNDPNALDDVDKLVEGSRKVAATALGILLTILFLIFTLGLTDNDKLIKDAFKVANFIADFDKELFAVLPTGLIPEAAVGGPEKITGLGHFINVQPQVGGWPSNEFDAHQGIFYDEAYYNVGDGSIGQDQRFQDSYDHFLIDMTGLGVIVNPEESFAVSHYQNGSIRRVEGWDPEESYWQEYEMHAIPMTPLEKLADYGWRAFRDDPCKTADSLLWPLHALGDASVPMHVIGTTGQGHRPFEDSIHSLAGQWEAVRHLAMPPRAAMPEFAPKADESHEYPPGGAVRLADFQDQYTQARSILEQAFHWSQEIQHYQTSHQATDIDIRALITEVAQQTLATLRSQTAKLRCDRNACQSVQLPNTSCTVDPGNRGACQPFFEIHCDGHCDGFLDDPRSSGLSDPTANHLHCWLSGANPNALPQCTIEARVAEQLSSSDYANVIYPAVLAPGLSDEWDGSHQFATPFYAAYVDDHRRFAEIGTAATLAFLVHASELVAYVTAPQACLCGGGDSYCTTECVNLQTDHGNCGSCGHACPATASCTAGVCNTSCAAPWTSCSGTCVDFRFDESNCGACGNTCAQNFYCEGGYCHQLL